MESFKEKIVNLKKNLSLNQLYFRLLMIIEFIIFLIIVYKYNPYYNKLNDSALTQFIVLIVGFIYVLFFIFFKNKLITENNFIQRIIFTLLFFIIFIILTISIVWIFSNFSIISSIISNGLIFILLICVISIIYYLLKISIDKFLPENGFLSFIKNIILFIPCLLIRFTEYIKYEYNITTKPIWILLIVEFILIFLWIIIPIIINYYFDKDGIKLLVGPKYLNNKYDIGNFENLHKKNLNEKDSKFIYHYSISAWFNINPQPPNTSSAYTLYTSILNYGNKPNIQYNGEKNSLRVITTLDDKNGEKLNEVEIFETKNILYQKWNNIVINYDGGDMDVFLNGELVGSKPNIAPYMTYENISVGEINGIHGGICNVKYYNHILSKKDIKITYKLLRDSYII